ncbi:NADPH-dependent F420 reductase [Rhizosphaericola mali]|uniref:NADP oxidoreductase coenzyme F420-dependent n=1 Tax=Rhizosphaericola mali TaxID=2545455 RepID=A0A5P2FZN0_9BACT|nr:NAD(P)-binding domain-containing protein [Rhizosphaericola mali]QES88417.1 NADP oxidoreductase coenzyme F420-dependent [Rhizosphaericola mali]
MSSIKKVAVIGLGSIGKAVAKNLVKGNHPVIVASRKLEDAHNYAKTLGSLATATDTESAIKEADILILSVWFDVEQELLKKHASELDGKIIIDPSNPIVPDEKGGFKKIISENESSGEIIATLVPSNAKFVKAFGTLGAETLGSAAFATPERNVLFYASDDQSVDDDIENLITDSGFDAVKVGGINKSIRIEVFGDLNEFGGLGKAITKEVAVSKL